MSTYEENGYTDFQDSLDTVDVILQHIALLDQAASEKELNNVIPLLLEAVGKYTAADRVYIFDWSSEAHEAYTNTFEWCKEGVTPQIDNLQNVPLELMCNWQESFVRGRTVIIPDVEQIRTTMPYEYVLLKRQHITSVITVPLFANNRLNGFIGVDDPKPDMGQLSVKLLTDIAGHLGCVRDNLQMITLLAQKQESLQQSLKELAREKKLLEALCTDYTAVLYCDLKADTLEVVKQDEVMYPNVEKKLKEKEVYGYTHSIRYYYENYVIKDSAPEFLRKLSCAYLRKYLSHETRMTYRYQVKDNPAGWRYFEVQAVRMRWNEDTFRVVMGYRYIDDIVEDEERQKRRLEKALEETRQSNEIISAISKNYQLIYRMDLKEDLYEEITSEEDMYRLTGRRGKISVKFKKARETMVAAEFQLRMKEFLDMETLPDRLADTEQISMEYMSTMNNWYEAQFIVKHRERSGEVTNVLYVVRQINAQKEQELEYQKQLMKAAEEARRANIAKTDFLRRMSHDVRTPINGIRGLIEIANHYPDDLARQAEYREKITEASDVLLELVNRVLDMNRLESGDFRLEYKPFNLRDLLKDIYNLMHMQAGECGLYFTESQTQIRHENLLGSPQHVQQIWMNIIENAIKYNRSGGSVMVSCREMSATREQAVFELVCVDTGRGMSEAFQKRLFEAFSQEERNARTNNMGTGLGLTIVKELVESMGGTIHFKSKINEGSSFSIVLPLDIDQFNVYQTVQTEDTYPYEQIHVLLVEDNATNMEIAEFALQNKGVQVTRAWNGKEACELFRAAEPGTYDVILMDIMMPVMGGLEATRAIRDMKHPDAANIPIFAMTANAFVDDIEKSRLAGMNEHLIKPLEIDKILEKIRKYCPKEAKKERDM